MSPALAAAVALALAAADVPVNRLAGETSPYLRQHAHNPVAWQPWGPAAFARAKREDKLVFLSVGYSACHWCHVMEKESFADAGIAAVLNRHFVCIKVDREERPDVDEAYMAALHALGLGGGWPMSVFLTPDAKPIFGGTYWPPRDRKAADGDTETGFLSVLNRVNTLAKTDRAGLYKQADKVAELTNAALNKPAPKDAPKLGAPTVADATDAYEFDPEFGGFAMRANRFRGSKFPRVPALLFLLSQSADPAREPLRKSLRVTLDRMAAGGVYDHLAGGFHRYSVDRQWRVPHFEKMLYDQAQTMELYSTAAGSPLARKDADAAVVAGIAGFVARELTSPAGAFYSALDADSDGREGAHTVWTPAELDVVIGAGPAALALRAALGMTGPAEFDGKAYVPHLVRPDDVGKPDTPEVAALKAKLLAARGKRPQPARDDKVLAGWNGQMIAGYAAAGKAFNEPKYTAAAARAADFVLGTMRDKSGKLLRVYAAPPGSPPRASGPAFLDDYAYLTHGMLNLHAATGDARWLTAARQLADTTRELFEDKGGGGFFLTPAGVDALFVRGKDHYDGAQPSPAGTAARNFARLAQLTGDANYWTAADRAVRAFAGPLTEHPGSCPVTAGALAILLGLPKP